MIISISFVFKNKQPWQFDQSLIQGMFYSLLPKNSKYHDTDFGLFCVSNIFFEKNNAFEANKKYNFLFSSIDKGLVEAVYEGFLYKKLLPFGNANEIIIQNIISKNANKIWSGKMIKMQTPIVIGLDKEVCEKYGISYLRDGKSLYRNKNMGFDVFVAQLNKNILRKYLFLMKEGYLGRLSTFDQKLLALDLEPEKFTHFATECNFFSGYKFRRGALVDYKGSKVAGSLRDFTVGENPDLVKVLSFVSQIGFGQKCTAGFGFVG